MRRNGLARPHGANFAGRVVAYRDDEIHLRRIRRGEFIPAFAAQGLCRIVQGLELFQRQGIDRAARLATGAVGVKASFTQGVEQGLGHDAARGIAGAKKEYVVDLVSHDEDS
ncbi:hypothetical protein D3C86_1823600 [compost metagenome]